MQVDILAIGAHPDDVELACAGSLIKHIRRGYKVGLCDLTRGELGTRGSVEVREREAAESARVMGASFRQNLGMADGGFVNDRENQLKLIEVIRYCKPTLVLANALSDRHPDHGRAAKLIADACYYSGLRKIESQFRGNAQDAHRPAQLLHYVQDYYREPDFVVDVTEVFDEKLECVRAFASQFYDPNSEEPDTPLTGVDFFDFLRARARDVGRPAGYELGEAFECSRVPGVRDLLKLD